MKVLSKVYLYITVYLVILSLVRSKIRNLMEYKMLWPKATIPYYIDPKHYDQQQIFSIMACFMMFSSKTCVKFVPLTSQLEKKDHVLLVENPTAERRCYINSKTYKNLRKVTIGYDCLKSTEINTNIIRSLGVLFKTNMNDEDPTFDNRIQDQNLSRNHYEVNQLHFEMVNISYKRECQLRDHQADIKLCKSIYYKQRIKETKNTIRKKRETKDNNNRSTEDYNNTVNNIKVKEALEVLGIENEFDELADKIHNMVIAAFDKAREKQCKPTLRSSIFVPKIHPKLRQVHYKKVVIPREGYKTIEANVTTLTNPTNDIKNEGSIWQMMGMNLVGSMSQYIMKNVSLVVNLVNFENPDPKTLNKDHYSNVEWTTIQFR